MRLMLPFMLLALVGCAGQSEPRIANAQSMAINRVATSLQAHNVLHAKEQAAYTIVKEKEIDALFQRSVAEAKEDAKKDPSITTDELVAEILKRVDKRDENRKVASATVDLMKKAQEEANKPAKDAAELLGIVLKFEQTDGFSYTELINTLSPLVPSPVGIGK